MIKSSHHNLESIEKSRSSHKGQIPWNKGKKGVQVAWNKGIPMQEVSKRKVGEKNKGKFAGKKNYFFGKHLTPWNKDKKGVQVAWNKGKHWNQETKEKMSKAKKGKYVGKNNPYYGKKHSPEIRMKISKARIGKVPSNKGVPMKEEQKKKLSLYVGAQKGNWKGGVTPEHELARRRAVSLNWRRAVLERDNHICQKCGGQIKLRAHHLDSFSDFPELRYVVSNGITFCEKCHMDFHKKYGKNNNTKCQTEEFLGHPITENNRIKQFQDIK